MAPHPFRPHPNRRSAAGTPEDPILAAGIVLWRPEDDGPHFLLLRNALHHTWGFPKGHLDGDEGLVEAALREVEEETGISLTADELAPEFADTCIYQPHGRSWKRTVLYLARCPDGAELRLSAEHDRGRWAPEQEALELLEHEDGRRTLIRAVEWLRIQSAVR